MNKNILKKSIILISYLIILLGYSFVFAEDLPNTQQQTEIVPISIHLNIISGSSSLYNNDISVTPCDSDNDSTTPDTITAYCAILQSGLPSTWSWDWAPGAFVNSIGNISGYKSKDTEDNDVYHYWSWSSNGALGMSGLNEYNLQPRDTILLEFIDPQPEIVTLPEAESIKINGSRGGSIPKIENKNFSTSNALNFLLQNQKNDGSFGYPMYTDWAVIAIATVGDSNIKLNLSNYLKSNEINSAVVTDNERHAMALMSLGINPYNGTNINYIKKITDSFDGIQFGDNTLNNDDIFALIVLAKSGYLISDELIKKDLSYLLSKQDSNGSWGNVDITSAAIEALYNFRDLNGVSESISRAYDYIISNQAIDGGFSNSSSTTWAIQAMSLNALSYNENINSALKYLALKQQDDGGIEEKSNSTDSRVWVTSYAIPAALNLSWNDILKYFDREVILKHAEDNNLQNEAIEELSKAQETQGLDLTKEGTLKKEIVVKQKTNLIKKVIKDTPIVNNEQEKLLSVNIKNTNQNLSIIKSILSIIIDSLKTPFIWLWQHLYI